MEAEGATWSRGKRHKWVTGGGQAEAERHRWQAQLCRGKKLCWITGNWSTSRGDGGAQLHRGKRHRWGTEGGWADLWHATRRQHACTYEALAAASASMLMGMRGGHSCTEDFYTKSTSGDRVLRYPPSIGSFFFFSKSI